MGRSGAPGAEIPALIQALRGMKRIAIVGGPRTGKSTLASRLRTLGAHEIHTDDFSGLPWGLIPAEVAKECARHDRFIVEGVQVARCLRKGLEVDAVIVLSAPKVQRTAHQDAMAKGTEKIFRDWRDAPGPKPAIIYMGEK